MSKAIKIFNIRKHRRVNRTRAKLQGTADRPRLAVFRSNQFTSVQLVDDTQGKTLVAVSSREIKNVKGKVEAAREVGEALAKKAAALGVKAAVFDRRSYRYHGRVRALAEGARKGGLKI
ncbi:MAG: 50S ribosomal protein L18 [bacterium]|nr:50S ribosomal protein L18 [bacterium]